MRVRVSRVSAGGSYARVTRIGPDRERAFVLVPGIGVMSNYFERLAFRLADFGPVIAVDLPGFGGVPHPPGGTLDVLGYADVLGQVLDALDLIDPIVLGHSMGTQIAAELATRRRLSDLVLISPVVNPRDRALPVAALRFAQSTLHEPPKVWALSLYAYALSGLRWTWRVLPDVLRFPIEDTLTRVEANTLVLTGEQDRLCPRGWAREVGRLLSTAQVWRVPGAAHSVMHRGAEDVARLCVAHVRRELPPDDDIRWVPHRVEDEPHPRLTSALRGGWGRLVELVGILRGDDDTIAAGKTLHARAAADGLPDRSFGDAFDPVGTTRR